MELLSQYRLGSSSSSESQCECSVDESPLTQQQVRSVYLLTFSQADLSIFPDKESFASAVCEAVLKCDGPKAKIVQWTCCKEKHKKGGTHFHMAIKLNKIKWWLPIRQYLRQKWNVNVHFSHRHVNYYSAWLYTTKEDKEFLQSSNHPDLVNSRPPKTMSASQARMKRQRVETGNPSKDSATSGEEEAVEGHEEEGGSSASRESARRSTKRR